VFLSLQEIVAILVII